jgi:predicted DNA-binding protein
MKGVILNAKYVQRMPDDLHDRAKKLAKKLGMSLNAFVNMSVHEQLLDVDDLEKRVVEIEKQMKEMQKK